MPNTKHLILLSAVPLLFIGFDFGLEMSSKEPAPKQELPVTVLEEVLVEDTEIIEKVEEIEVEEVPEIIPQVPDPVIIEEVAIETEIEEILELIKEQPTTEVLPSFSEINEEAREALVNIFCQMDTPKFSGFTTGSGAIIDPRGIILTNAHVAQSLILPTHKDEVVFNCTIRMGAPAIAMYKAELLYLPTEWFDNNPQGTFNDAESESGQYDFALLEITEHARELPLPTSFPYLSLSTSESVQNDQVLVTGYPGEYLSPQIIFTQFHPVSTQAIVSSVTSYDAVHPDVLILGDTLVSQLGSSGGPVVDKRGELTGIVTGLSIYEESSTRDLQTITLNHIDRSMADSIGTTLSVFLENLSQWKDMFQEEHLQELRSLLIEILY